MNSLAIKSTTCKTSQIGKNNWTDWKSLKTQITPYCVAALVIVLAIGVSLLLTPYITHQNMLMIYTLAVAFIATRYSLGPSLFGWLISIVGFSYFIAPPRFNIMVEDWHNLLTFAAVLLLAIIMSRRTSLLKVYTNELEKLVADRTAQLVTVNENLSAEIEQRKASEKHLRLILRELSEANTALKSFAKIASHDLREPLKAVQGYVELIERRYGQILGQEIMQFITYIHDSVLRMDRLIQGVSTCCQMEAKENKFASCDINKIVDEAITNLSFAIEESKSTITVDPLPTLTVDRSQLVHLFQNLISNAMKFKGKDDPKIHISARRVEQEWIFSVTDNGIGIDKKYCQQIFGMFQRIHSRTQYPGSGIGLAICKTIVENHGGKIWVESKPDIGSNFRFSLLEEDASYENSNKNT